MTQISPWGWITIIDAGGCDGEAINDPKVFREFVDEVLDKIEMIPIGDLHIMWCVTNDPKKVGYSIYQLLQDSNISAHFCSADNNSAYVDIFSCKEYDPQVVLDIFFKYFKPLHYTARTLTRSSSTEF